MNKLFTALFLIFVIFACSQGGGKENESGGSLLRPAVNSSIDLRLGQISSGSSPVAVSAALENQETITIFNNESFSESEVVYVTPSAETALIKYDRAGRPSSALLGNVLINYDNYTKEDTVDITIQLLAGVTAQTNDIFLPNQAIDPNVLLFLEGDTILNILLGIDQDTDSTIREWLASALAALRFVACNADNNISEALSGLYPESFTSALCSSSLLNAVEDILGKSNYQDISVNLTNRYPDCTSATSDEEKIACSISVSEDIVDAAEQSTVGDFPKISTPTPIAKNPFFGNWSGIIGGSGGVIGCRDFEISFSVKSTAPANGNVGSCTQPCTSLNGTLTALTDSLFFMEPFTINGIVESDGRFQFTGKIVDANGGTRFSVDTMNGTLAPDGTGSGTFVISPLTCTRTFTVTKASN